MRSTPGGGRALRDAEGGGAENRYAGRRLGDDRLRRKSNAWDRMSDPPFDAESGAPAALAPTDEPEPATMLLGESQEFLDMLHSEGGGNRKCVDPKLVGCVGLFLLAYCVQPLLVDALKFEGAAATSACLYLIPHFLGMLCVVFSPNESRRLATTPRGLQGRKWPLHVRELHLNRRAWKKAFFVAGIDLLHQAAEKAGLVLCGSGVYVLISSSSIVWTALISACILRRRFSPFQWFSLLLICGGISMKASDLTFEMHNEESVGVVVTLLSAILQGLTFVVNEKFMTSSNNPVSGPSLVFMMGVICSSLLMAWTCLWTLPNFQVLIVDRVRERGGSPVRIAAIMFGLFCSGAVHSSTLWYIVKRLGAVTSGVLKGVKTASVFLLGHVFFCHLQASQCLTPVKTASAAVCVGGVILYYVAASRAQQPATKRASPSSGN
ncbi:transporter/permease protein [Besnoitia besnoiti]|uniref:Transporter/permease protein n=1 Tax=Besnoitia besnoiti TaxID=94643 RepID=A0A2A9M3W9_BESBE|nr:transporter/permease protein [Besnoitia besnoiti]PFH31914.1 transporter/permease protein [Besnoitia besnoiti]